MKLIGYLDGNEVSFDFVPPNLFKAEIPKKFSGIYIIELHAVDDAGNQANMCNIMVLIDFDRLTFKVIDSGLISKTDNKNYICKELQQRFSYRELVV